LRAQLAVVVVLGLGPLVRPILRSRPGVFLVATWMIVRPRWTRTLALAAAAAANPDRLRDLSRRLLRHAGAAARHPRERDTIRVGARWPLPDRLRAAVRRVAAGTRDAVLAGIVIRTRAIARRGQGLARREIVLAAGLIRCSCCASAATSCTPDACSSPPDVRRGACRWFVLPVRRLTVQFINRDARVGGDRRDSGAAVARHSRPSSASADERAGLRAMDEDRQSGDRTSRSSRPRGTSASRESPMRFRDGKPSAAVGRRQQRRRESTLSAAGDLPSRDGSAPAACRRANPESSSTRSGWRTHSRAHPPSTNRV